MLFVKLLELFDAKINQMKHKWNLFEEKILTNET